MNLPDKSRVDCQIIKTRNWRCRGSFLTWLAMGWRQQIYRAASIDWLIGLVWSVSLICLIDWLIDWFIYLFLRVRIHLTFLFCISQLNFSPNEDKSLVKMVSEFESISRFWPFLKEYQWALMNHRSFSLRGTNYSLWPALKIRKFEKSLYCNYLVIFNLMRWSLLWNG